MTVDDDCKNQIIAVIKSELNKLGPIMKIGAKIMAENKLQEFINNVQSTEMNLTLSNYVNTRPEIRNEHPEAFRLLPHCAYKYTMIELIECLNDI